MNQLPYDELEEQYIILQEAYDRLLEEFDEMYLEHQELLYAGSMLVDDPKNIDKRKRFVKTVTRIRNKKILDSSKSDFGER